MFMSLTVQSCLCHSRFNHAYATHGSVMFIPLTVPSCLYHSQFRHVYPTHSSVMFIPLTVPSCLSHSQLVIFIPLTGQSRRPRAKNRAGTIGAGRADVPPLHSCWSRQMTGASCGLCRCPQRSCSYTWCSRKLHTHKAHMLVHENDLRIKQLARNLKAINVGKTSIWKIKHHEIII